VTDGLTHPTDTWTTTGGGGGTYRVTALVSWQFANFQTEVGFIDNIGEGTKANGTAVLEIAFSDGSTGVLTVGCHGPGAPPGIFEGIATTKGYKTYYTVQAPAGGVDAQPHPLPRTLVGLRPRSTTGQPEGCPVVPVGERPALHPAVEHRLTPDCSLDASCRD
jgi:hypothetical protein